MSWADIPWAAWAVCGSAVLAVLLGFGLILRDAWRYGWFGTASRPRPGRRAQRWRNRHG